MVIWNYRIKKKLYLWFGGGGGGIGNIYEKWIYLV